MDGMWKMACRLLLAKGNTRIALFPAKETNAEGRREKRLHPRNSEMLLLAFRAGNRENFLAAQQETEASGNQQFEFQDHEKSRQLRVFRGSRRGPHQIEINGPFSRRHLARAQSFALCPCRVIWRGGATGCCRASAPLGLGKPMRLPYKWWRLFFMWTAAGRRVVFFSACRQGHGRWRPGLFGIQRPNPNREEDQR